MADESINEPITPGIVTPDEIRSRSSERKPVALKSGSTTQPNPRRASTGSFGNRGRKFSSGKSSPLSGGESPVPNYLRASTGSCHDFCKYGKKHENETEGKPWQNRSKKVTTPTLDKQNGSETGDLSKKKITKAVKKPPISRTNSHIPSTSHELDTAVNEKKNNVIEKRITLGLSGKKESEIKPVKTKGISKEPIRGKLVSSPVAYLATKPSFNRDLGLKFIANTSKKLVSPPKVQSKVAKFEIKRVTNDTVKEKTLHVIKVEAKKTVPKLREKNQEIIKEVENEIVENEKVTRKQNDITTDSTPSESFSTLNIASPAKSPALSDVEEEALDELEYINIEKKVGSNDSLPSESFSSSSISSQINFPALSCVEEEVQDELEYNNFEKKYLELEQNENTCDSFPFESISSPNISPPVKSPTLSCAEQEAQDELEYFDSETDRSDQSISKSSEILNSDDEGTSIQNQNIEDRKAKGVSEDNDKATKLKFKRGKVVDIESNSSGPRRLKFRRARVLGENKDNDENNRRRSFTNGESVDDVNTNDDSEKVVLRRQQAEGKKDAQGLFNNVIEETASKLAETRKSKVKALVGAFETVISLQESKPSTPTAP